MKNLNYRWHYMNLQKNELIFMFSKIKKNKFIKKNLKVIFWIILDSRLPVSDVNNDIIICWLTFKWSNKEMIREFSNQRRPKKKYYYYCCCYRYYFIIITIITTDILSSASSWRFVDFLPKERKTEETVTRCLFVGFNLRIMMESKGIK